MEQIRSILANPIFSIAVFLIAVIVIIIAVSGFSPIADFLGTVLGGFLSTVLSVTIKLLSALLRIVGVFLLAGLITLDLTR